MTDLLDILNEVVENDEVEWTNVNKLDSKKGKLKKR